MTSLASESGERARGALPAGPRWVSRVWKSHSHRLLGVVGVVLFLVVWEWSSRSGAINPMLFSSPSRIVAAYRELIENGELVKDLAASSRVFITGFGVSVLVGVPIGFLMGWYQPMQAILNPFVNFFNATPRIALLPLFLIWFGIGLGSKVAVVFLGAVFPILINSITGIRSLDSDVLRAARSFGASDLQIFRTVGLPGSLPFVLSGLRLGLALALTGTVVAELYAATAGIGYLIAISGSRFKTDYVLVGITVVAITGVLLSMALLRLERHFQSWKAQS